jgi:Domain of unknown function (DUF4251)
MLRHTLIAAAAFLIVMVSCKAPDPAKQAEEAAHIKSLIDSKSYVFKAQTVIPSGAPSRQLRSDYDLRITPDKVVCYLPYMGTATSASAYSTENSLDFTSKEFDYAVVDREKGGWDITIKPKDRREPRAIQMTVYTNGTASLIAFGNNKSNISFNGYITEDRTKK